MMPRMRDEIHYGDRLVRCYVDRPPHVDQMFKNTASRHPDVVALVDGNRRMSYAELDWRVGAIAANLVALGIGRMDRVALMIANRSEFVEAVLAVARLGAISVPINIRQQKPEIESALADSEAKVFIHDAELIERLPDAAVLPALKYRCAIGMPDPGAMAYADLLKPAPAAELAAELAALAGGAERLAERAAALAEDGRTRLAAHLAEFAARASPGDKAVQATRAMVLGQCMERETSLMGKAFLAVYQREAKARSGG